MATTDPGFETSPLWRGTLGSTRDEDTYERERLRLSYLATRNNATVLLNELSHSVPDFTVHDISHVDALWETADMLCGSSVALTPAEAYVLGCAFIMHDAAMGEAAHEESIPDALGRSRWHDLLATYIVRETGNWPAQDELSKPDYEIAKACQVHAIRELHAAHAAKLVDQSWKTSSGNEFHLIEDLQLRESYGTLIGQLAASHWWPVDRLHSEFRRVKGSLPWQPAGWIVDPLKLACILRLADATQIDSRRAPSFLFALRRPEGASQEHWRFQEHVSRPRLIGDRVTYSAWRPFDTNDADAWWLALDYLRAVDGELKKVDALLHDMSKPRFEGRAVAGVDTPERFAEHFPVRGWRPVDARIAITDAPHLVEVLGGEQLYGKVPEVALRELLQNAQDAVTARKALESDFTDDEIQVSLIDENGIWTLIVADRGVGMDEDILTSALLDFGRSGWSSDVVRNKFVGLADGGFRPKGRFGIGFFSVFILGDNIEVLTRRFDAGPGEARRLRFRGVRQRPILTPISSEDRAPVGTTIRVVLKTNPYDSDGLFNRTSDEELVGLIQRLWLQRSVPVRAREPQREVSELIAPTDLATATAEEVFDLLYPPSKLDGPIRETQRQAQRIEFAQRATELIDSRGRRVGLAAIGEELSLNGPRTLQGTVVVDGFRADEEFSFTGYLIGRPSRASRDRVELAVESSKLRAWLVAQEDRLRELGQFSPSTQLFLAYLLYAAHGKLRDDHFIAFTSGGLTTLAEFFQWAEKRDDIILCQGVPITVLPRPISLVRRPSYAAVNLPEGWVYPFGSYAQIPFHDMFDRSRDERYSPARFEQENTWQKMWWRTSGLVEGIVLKLICEAWKCDIRDILEPVAKRGWNDFAKLDGDASPVPVYLLKRPTAQV